LIWQYQSKDKQEVEPEDEEAGTLKSKQNNLFYVQIVKKKFYRIERVLIVDITKRKKLLTLQNNNFVDIV